MKREEARRSKEKQKQEETEARRRKKAHESILGNAKQKSRGIIKRGGALAKVWCGGRPSVLPKKTRDPLSP